MRTIVCSCGVIVTAPDHDVLFYAYRTHLTTAHPRNRIPDELLRTVLLPMVYDPDHAADDEPLTEREVGAS